MDLSRLPDALDLNTRFRPYRANRWTARLPTVHNNALQIASDLDFSTTNDLSLLLSRTRRRRNLFHTERLETNNSASLEQPSTSISVESAAMSIWTSASVPLLDPTVPPLMVESAFAAPTENLPTRRRHPSKSRTSRRFTALPNRVGLRRSPRVTTSSFFFFFLFPFWTFCVIFYLRSQLASCALLYSELT